MGKAASDEFRILDENGVPQSPNSPAVRAWLRRCGHGQYSMADFVVPLLGSVVGSLVGVWLLGLGR